MPHKAVQCARTVALIENRLSVRKEPNVTGYSRTSINRAMIRFRLIRIFERRPGSGPQLKEMTVPEQLREDFKKLDLESITRLHNPDFRHAIEELVEQSSLEEQLEDVAASLCEDPGAASEEQLEDVAASLCEDPGAASVSPAVGVGKHDLQYASQTSHCSQGRLVTDLFKHYS
ncbi:hypothetical protein J6590_028340 [Homalodisca vitripennis]|nr:hypothetical protein J6590_028340 [Homalodisca vitripennis]